MKTIYILRSWGDKNQTTGTCIVRDENKKTIFSSVCLERGDLDNAKGKSCIPEGFFDVVLEWSPRFEKNLWEVYGVPGRSECKFHAANYWYQLNGCIALGQKLRDINGDGYHDVTASRNTMAAFHRAMGSDTKALLIVKWMK